jgi:hypothetical protein
VFLRPLRCGPDALDVEMDQIGHAPNLTSNPALPVQPRAGSEGR